MQIQWKLQKTHNFIHDKTPDNMYTDKAGRPLSRLGWVRRFENTYYKRVDLTSTPTHLVSTVWVGLVWDEFETMVFEHGSYTSLDEERYTTLAEAKEGHKRMLEKWRNGDPTTKAV